MKIVAGLVLLVGAFVWGLAAGTYEVFPYELVRSAKNAIDGDDGTRDPTEYIGNPDATASSDGDIRWGTRADNVLIGDSLIADARIEEMFTDVSIANRGVGGDTIQGVLDRLPAILALEPKRAVIFVGHNDVLFENPNDKILDRFATLIDRLQAAGVEPVVQSVLVCGTISSCTAVRRDNTVRLNVGLKALAERKDIPFVDLNAAISDQSGVKPALTWDGLHLNGEGFRTWRELTSPYLYRSEGEGS